MNDNPVWRRAVTTLPKDWYRSKTIAVNALTLFISLAGVFAASDLLANHPSLVLVLTGVVIPIANIFLRFITRAPIDRLR